MPLQSLKLRPGIVTDITDLSNSGGWSSCDKVRFRMGFPETIGGWHKRSPLPFLGTCRAIHQWTALDGTNYTALGTHLKLYVEEGGTYYDITPIRRTVTLAANPFTTQSVSNGKLTVTDTAHGALLNDFVTFSGATAFDNYTTGMLNAEFQIIEILTANTYTIEVSGVLSAGAGVSGGGGAVQAVYQINTGPDIQIAGDGWGSGFWGRGTWGSSSSSTVNQIRLWSLDNFGEDLVAAVRGGAIYQWDASVGTGTRAVNLSTISGATQVPTVCLGIIVSEIDRHLIAFGANENGSATQDLMLVRWCSAEDILDWEEANTTNTAGSYRISSGSKIVGWTRVRQEIPIWTDIGFNTMAFTGPPYTFGFNLMAENISLLGPNAMGEDRNTLFWMDQNSFRYYDGSVNTLACPVQAYVFQNLNSTQRFKVFCGSNTRYNEIWWFYPSADSSGVDRYVGYNYVDNVWFIGGDFGGVERSAWWDVEFSGYPVAAGGGYLWLHEYGVNADGGAMEASIEGADLEILEGDQYSFIDKIIPDITFTGSNMTPEVDYTILRRNFPGQDFTTGYVSSIGASTKQAFVRVRGRQFALRVDGAQQNMGWRLGTTRLNMQPDGRKV